MIYLCAGFINEGSDFPCKCIERLHWIRGRNAPPPVIPPSFPTLGQTVIIATEERNAPTESFTKFTLKLKLHVNESINLPHLQTTRGENYLLPGVLGTCSTVRWASGPWGSWAGTNTTPPSFPACNTWRRTRPLWIFFHYSLINL